MYCVPRASAIAYEHTIRLVGVGDLAPAAVTVDEVEAGRGSKLSMRRSP
jgi:hypothetical protein